MKKKIHILGAGPAGLVLAWQLLKKGFEVSIYEKNNQVGGMCRTWKWNGFFVDTGPHIFHTPNAKLSKFWEREFNGLFSKGNFWCKNVVGDSGDFWDYPLSIESIKKYPLKLKRTILDELKNKKESDKLKAKTYQEFVNCELGPTLAEMFFKHYPEKVWGIKTNEMTSDWAPKRIKLRKKNTPFYYNEWNAVGKYGTGCIYEKIQKNINKLKGNIFFNKKLVQINHVENNISNLVFDKGFKVKINPEDYVISSLPINYTSKLLGYDSHLEFRGIRSVFLSFKKDFIFPKNIHWMYFGEKNIIFNRVTEPKKLSKHVAPNNRTYLTAEIAYSKNDIIDKMKDEKIIKRVLSDLIKLKIVNKKDFERGSSNKEPFVYPLMNKGYRNELTKTKSKLLKYSQLFSIGTGGDFNYSDSQVIFHKAFDLANTIGNIEDSKRSRTVRSPEFLKFNENIHFNNLFIGEKYPPLIIAEAGINHNGNVDLAKDLIDQAQKAGCRAIKFQTYSKNSRVSNKFKSANYAEFIDGQEENLNQMFNRYRLSFNDQEKIFKYAKRKKIMVFSTPFDFESVDFLEKQKVQIYKIASMDLVNLPLIEYVAKKNKPVILSTGMSTLSEIEDAVNCFKETGNKNLAILHCNSTYPADIEDANLKVIDNLKKIFGTPVGLSDHCDGILTSVAAISRGANVIERHFTLNKYMEGPDHIFSSEKNELSELINFSNKINGIVGDGIKRILPTEYETINLQRKSIYVNKKIKAGHTIKINDIAIKGPGGGIIPKYIKIILGRKVNKVIENDYPLKWEDLQ